MLQRLRCVPHPGVRAQFQYPGTHTGTGRWLGVCTSASPVYCTQSHKKLQEVKPLANAQGEAHLCFQQLSSESLPAGSQLECNGDINHNMTRTETSVSLIKDLQSAVPSAPIINQLSSLHTQQCQLPQASLSAQTVKLPQS